MVLQQVAKIVETLPSWRVIYLPIISHTAPPPPLLINVVNKTKQCWKLKQSTLKGGEGRGSGKGLSSKVRWVLEARKGVLNESVLTILRLLVAIPSISKASI